jgi:transcription elongation factor GreA-like protein
VYADKLEKVLSIVTPSDELVVWNISILSKEQIRAIESLALKRLEVQSKKITRELLEQVNAIKVQKKFVTGISENKEVWSEEVIAAYGHLFRKGDELRLDIRLKEGNQESLLKRASDNMSKAP